MPWLRGNLHAHTTFSDGVKEPAQLVAAYEALGYDFLAITDHENWIDDRYWNAIPRVSSKLLLFHGIELNWRRFDQHIGKVSGERETLHVLNHPARYQLSVAQTLERIRRIGVGGITLDAIEVTDTGQRQPIYESSEIPLVKIATGRRARAHPLRSGVGRRRRQARPRRDHSRDPRRRVPARLRERLACLRPSH